MKEERRFILPEEQNKEMLLRILDENPEIRFVSVAGVDLMGHETDEKIPVAVFRKDLDTFLNGTAVQTDGSSVILPGIATLNNAKIDMKLDCSVKWWIDRNVEHLDPETGKPVATIKIPCFLFHDGKAVDSRSILNRASSHFKAQVRQLLESHPESLLEMGITPGDIDRIDITAATELEFWVKTPDENRDMEELSVSQELKEQYWARTRGNVRTALEKTLLVMADYGLQPEMGHKEVGGVKSRLNQKGSLQGIMEQLEIDWRFDKAVEAADNEIMVKLIVKEVFRHMGMEVTFLAKPMEGVAGSGEHVHLGVMLTLKDGRNVNLFDGGRSHFMSRFGYAALMGLLNNYEIISPFIVQSNDAFRRLKKGYEAPICTVTSLGQTLEIPSRNRSILVGLIRDVENPLATRFELRSPNPHTNTYLAMTTVLQTMLHGMTWAVESGKTEDDLLKELSKAPGEEAQYLETERMYRSEEDVFTAFTDEERERYFGHFPATVWENVRHFELYAPKKEVLTQGGVLTEQLIDSFGLAVTSKWALELDHRIIPNFIKEIRSMKKLHHSVDSLDEKRWNRIHKLRQQLMVDEEDQLSVIGTIHQAILKKDYQTASDAQIRMYELMAELNGLYRRYRMNILD